MLETFPNLVTMFFARAEAKGDAPFLWHKPAASEGDAKAEWQPLSWADAARQVAALAQAIEAMGLSKGDRIVLVSENRPEWCIADLAIMAAGCVTVPAYITNTERDHGHILDDSGACAVIVSTPKLARALLPALARSGCERLIAIEPLEQARIGAIKVFDWARLIAEHPADVAACAARQTAGREDLACIIYTSGTGGAPRGVRQHHGAILRNVAGCITIIEEDFPRTEQEIFLSLLPLSHAYEHSGGQYLPIGLGGQIYYAESIEKLAANIEEVRPTIMVVVPRLFELLRARILKAIEKQGGLSQWLLDKALALHAKEEKGLADKPLDLLLGATIRPKIAKRFGGRLKALVSGGAPLNPQVGGFFSALGVTLLQGYGQTEAAPVIACNRPRAGIRMDTVGPPLEGVEVRIAEDGEILVRGENVMHGYWRNAGESARVLKDGWLHTGDIGRLDEAGRLIITDRKKDIIVNDKGDNIAPQRIEGMLTLQPEIMQAAIFGDRRPYLVGLIVPEAGVDDASVAMAIDRVNAGLSVTERVRRFLTADEPFTTDNGEMTPSLKIRRHVVRERYGARLDGLYKS
ncbi:long-chain acyl-CoA synthetase [Sphingomonas vulcanisoli]|uniref:Long-chain acyl-CoA synthetase n=1 Tax=Sphingomonas vulcanisoli TaxID=1658060 RepID=A0ABX0TRJ0_9SPHN|nr:AMP-dependent synthetase/ligase [Sphingomonas vulcanisoli]NIJ07698.1 long-chain acyl-CoA synthetase [Sphingomonas vulcanisoli]